MPVILDISFGSVIGQTGNLTQLTNIFNQANRSSFYEQRKGVNFVSVRRNAQMDLEDLPLFKNRRMGQSEGPGAPRFAPVDNSANIALYVQDTTLVERLRMVEPPQTTSRKLSWCSC